MSIFTNSIVATIYTYKEANIWQDENGIICFSANADDIYDDNDLIAILDVMEQAADTKPFLLLMNSNGFEFLMTKEARNLFNTYTKAIELIRAEAVVIGSTTTKILYNLLTRIHRPKFPFKAFTDEVEARKWLLTFEQ